MVVFRQFDVSKALRKSLSSVLLCIQCSIPRVVQLRMIGHNLEDLEKLCTKETLGLNMYIQASY